MSTTTRASTSLSSDFIAGHSHGSVVKPNKSMCLDLIVQCLSGLDNVKATEYVSFAEARHEVQIKQLEFILGESKINMQILFERSCYVPKFVSVGSMTSQQTKEASNQTEDIIFHSNPHKFQDATIIQQNEQYRAEILRFRHENDELKGRNDEQNQTIRNMLHEIELKNELLVAAKAFIDDGIMSNEDADSSKHFAHDSHSTVDCQKCLITSKILAQTQLEKENLNSKNHQLTRIILSCEREVQTLDRKLQKCTEKQAHIQNEKRRPLDVIRHLQSRLETERLKATDRLRMKWSENGNHNLAKQSTDSVSTITSKTNGSDLNLVPKIEIESTDTELMRNNNKTQNEMRLENLCLLGLKPSEFPLQRHVIGPMSPECDTNVDPTQRQVLLLGREQPNPDADRSFGSKVLINVTEKLTNNHNSEIDQKIPYPQFIRNLFKTIWECRERHVLQMSC